MKIGYFVSVFVCRQTQAGPEFLQLQRALTRWGHFSDSVHSTENDSDNPSQNHLSDPSSTEVPNYMGGTWQLVTGKLEPNETAYRAAVRELLEETGLKPIDFYQVDRVNTFYLALNDSLNHVPMFCAMVSDSDEVILNDEHTAYRWLTPNSFAGQLMWPGERDAFAEVVREILNDGPAKKFLKIDLND